jgi:hypothetical protein
VRSRRRLQLQGLAWETAPEGPLGVREIASCNLILVKDEVPFTLEPKIKCKVFSRVFNSVQIFLAQLANF